VPLPLVLWKTYSTKPISERDKEFEKKVAAQKLEARPDEVSVESSVRHVIEESQAPAPKADADVLKDLKDDLVHPPPPPLFSDQRTDPLAPSTPSSQPSHSTQSPGIPIC
jgi:hypothetical protein